MSILEAKNIEKTFVSGEKKNHVLRGVDISVEIGEYLTVMGPSGSGKSTLLYSISSMDEIDSGEVFIDGSNVIGMDEEAAANLRLKKLGFIFQEATLIKHLNILDNIVLPAFALKKDSKEEIYRRARKLMQETGISHLEDRSVTQVSGGELQRSCICRALINSPKIIFGDEPTGALNSKNSAEIIQLLKEIQKRGTTIIIVTHDPKVAIASDRVVFMKDGQIAGEIILIDKDEATRQDLVYSQMAELNI